MSKGLPDGINSPVDPGHLAQGVNSAYLGRPIPICCLGRLPCILLLRPSVYLGRYVGGLLLSHILHLGFKIIPESLSKGLRLPTCLAISSFSLIALAFKAPLLVPQLCKRYQSNTDTTDSNLPWRIQHEIGLADNRKANTVAVGESIVSMYDNNS